MDIKPSKFFPSWLNSAITQLGIREIPGKENNHSIVQYHKTTEPLGDLETPDEVSWCSSFINWCFNVNSLRGTKSKVARSWLKWGKEMVIPPVGSVTIFKRGNSNWQGHVGLYLYEDEKKIYILGGNQGNTVSVMGYPKEKLLGYRWPI